MSITHVRIDRSETYQGGRVVSIAELREDYIDDLDLTGVPDDKVADAVADAISNHDDPYGELSEWLNKHNECIDSETKVTAFQHTCAGCGQPLMTHHGGWFDPEYRLRCGGWNAPEGAPFHKPAEPVEDTPEPAPASPLVGKTIASVATQRMTARDTYKDEVRWTRTTLTFTDGTTHVYGEPDAELYDEQPLTDDDED